MKSLKIIFPFILLLPLLASSGCTASKSVQLVLEQHKLIREERGDDGGTSGYYFGSAVLDSDVIEFEKDHYLTQEEINDYQRGNGFNYYVPPLNGDGYYGFTWFTLNFDESSGYSDNFLQPMKLSKSITVYYAIWG